MATNPRRLMELSMPGPLAKEVADNLLTIGTTSTTAMAGNRTPTTTIRGGVLQQTAITDLAGGADLTATVAKVNAILAALRAAGIIASS